MLPGSVRYAATWRSYYESERPPRLELPLRMQGMAASVLPVPQPYQTDLPPDIMDQLPGEAGRYPLGAIIPRYAMALRRNIDFNDPNAEPGLDWKEPEPEALPALSIVNRARHTTYAMTVPAADTPIVAGDPARTYLLIVNEDPANNARIAYDKSSNDGLLLTAGGGFHELVTGTQSEVRAQGVGGTALLKIVEGRAHPDRLCRRDCN